MIDYHNIMEASEKWHLSLAILTQGFCVILNVSFATSCKDLMVPCAWFIASIVLSCLNSQGVSLE